MWADCPKSNTWRHHYVGYPRDCRVCKHCGKKEANLSRFEEQLRHLKGDG